MNETVNQPDSPAEQALRMFEGMNHAGFLDAVISKVTHLMALAEDDPTFRANLSLNHFDILAFAYAVEFAVHSLPTPEAPNGKDAPPQDPPPQTSGDPELN